MKIKSLFCALLLALTFLLSGCDVEIEEISSQQSQALPAGYIASVNDVPAFTDKPYVVIQNNEPNFSDEDMKPVSFETYSELDSLGRCGVAYACIGQDIMPTEEREGIGQVKPSGWQTVKYDVVDGKYLYNRCHLIGFQLSGENANKKNLITGTRYLNVVGMLPFENMVADYVKESNKHVLYRVTPIFDGSNLVARGVQMEAKSVEDKGESICFNIYAYNNQPGVAINYATGESRLAESKPAASSSEKFILNTSSHKFHKSSCKLAQDIKDSNKSEFTGARDELIKQGYEPCKVCNP